MIAAVVMGLTVTSYAELCTRFPVAAGEAAYVRAAFGTRSLSTLTGLTMIATGIIATATVAVGSAGYIEQFVAAPQSTIIIGVIISLAAVSAWGVLESVLLACIFTAIEVGGLLLIIGAAWRAACRSRQRCSACQHSNSRNWREFLLRVCSLFLHLRASKISHQHGRRNRCT